MSESRDVVAHAAYLCGLERGELVIPRCSDCGEAFWYPRSTCPLCGSPKVDFSEVTTRGKVYSRTVVHRGSPPRGGDLPYVLALVEIAEGVRVLGTVVGDDADAVTAGDEVEFAVESHDGLSYPVWSRVEVEATA